MAVGVTVTGDDAAPVPTALVAATVNEYGTPLVSPVTVSVVVSSGVAEQVVLPEPVTQTW
jgi:hypothetical protein